jgi:hypothetical protein
MAMSVGAGLLLAAISLKLTADVARFSGFSAAIGFCVLLLVDALTR